MAATLLDCISDEDLRHKLLPSSYEVELACCGNLATDDNPQEESLLRPAVVLQTLRSNTLRVLQDTNFQTKIHDLFQSSPPCQALLPNRTATGAPEERALKCLRRCKELVDKRQTSPPEASPKTNALPVRRHLHLGDKDTGTVQTLPPQPPQAKKAKKGAPQDPQEQQHFEEVLHSLHSKLKQLDEAQKALLANHDTQSLLDHLSLLIIQTGNVAQPPASNNTSLPARHCSDPTLQQCITALSVSQELLQDSHKQVKSCFDTADRISRQAHALQTPSSSPDRKGEFHAQLADLQQRSSDAQQALENQAHVLFEALTRCRRALQTLKEGPRAGLAVHVPEDPSPPPQPGAAPRPLRSQERMNSRVAANNEHLDVSLQRSLNTLHHLRLQQASAPKVLQRGTRRAGHYLTVGEALLVKSGKNTVDVRTGDDEVHLEHFSRGCGQHHSTYTLVCLGCP